MDMSFSYPSIKNQTTTRKCIGNIYIWKFLIDTWGLDYNLFTISDSLGKKKKRREGKEEKGERKGGGGRKREEKETYIHRHCNMGCLFPRDTTAAVVHKKQHSEHSTGSKFVQLSLKMHNPFWFSKLNTEKYKMHCQYTYYKNPLWLIP